MMQIKRKVRKEKKCSVKLKQETHVGATIVVLNSCYNCSKCAISGSSNPVRDQRWRMEGCIHANGWGAMEATAERRVFDVRWYQKSSLPVIDHQRCRSLVRAKDFESWPSWAWSCQKQISASSEEAWWIASWILIMLAQNRTCIWSWGYIEFAEQRQHVAMPMCLDPSSGLTSCVLHEVAVAYVQ